MTAYSAATASLPMTCLNPGDSGLSFNAEAVSTGEAGQAFALNPGGVPAVAGAQYISVEVFLSGTVGSASFAVQTADTDTANAYQTEPSSTMTAFTNGYARAELLVKAKYVRAICNTAPGSGNATVKISR